MKHDKDLGRRHWTEEGIGLLDSRMPRDKSIYAKEISNMKLAKQGLLVCGAGKQCQ
jgi:hypothetical protein